jgi:hypothetical protein
LKVVSAARALKRSALIQCGSNVFAAISFRYTRGPAVRTTEESGGAARRGRRLRIMFTDDARFGRMNFAAVLGADWHTT